MPLRAYTNTEETTASSSTNVPQPWDIPIPMPGTGRALNADYSFDISFFPEFVTNNGQGLDPIGAYKQDNERPWYQIFGTGIEMLCGHAS